MAIFVTLFSATEEDLDRLFPGWSAPPEAPQWVTLQDPSTGEEKKVRRWIPSELVPEQSDLPLCHDVAPVQPPVLSPESDYERHMEERAPPLLRALPHACLKNLSGEHLDALASIVAGRSVQCMPARVTPDGFAVECLDPGATVGLASMQEHALPGIAQRWSCDARGFEGPADALWVLRRLHALARQTPSGSQRRLCLWEES
jgi:hypothetical protein